MCAKFFYILIVLMAGLFPFKMQASETKQTFILYTPYTKISVPPGESISYSIDVINNSDEVKNATLALAGLPKSWSYEMKAGGWTLDEIAVLPGEKKNFTLKVDVPLKVNKGTYHFTIGADGLARLPLAITVSKQGTYRTEFTTTQPNMQGNSKSTFTFNATLKNQTAEQQLYALMAEAPRGWNVIFKANYKQPLRHRLPRMPAKIFRSTSQLLRMSRPVHTKYLSSLLPAPLLPNSSLKWLSPDRTVLN